MSYEDLAKAVVHRRDELGMTQEEVSAAGGPSVGSLRSIEGAKRNGYRTRTFRDLDRALKWPGGTTQAILSGSITNEPDVWYQALKQSPATSAVNVTRPAEARQPEDAILLDVAEVYARRGTCSRLRVGAVLTRDGRILSTGRNGAPAGLEHCRHLDDEPCTVSVHAEANAIAFAARTGGGAQGATLYLTHAPCEGCSGLLINAGVRRVVYRYPYRLASGVDRLRDAGVEVEHLPEWRATS